jgi:hypothetical protein
MKASSHPKAFTRHVRTYTLKAVAVKASDTKVAHTYTCQLVCRSYGCLMMIHIPPVALVHGLVPCLSVLPVVKPELQFTQNVLLDIDWIS